jgi:PAS domain S-box-containing protein
VRLRLVALVLLVIAATAAGVVLTRVDSARDAWLVFATGLALAAVTGALALTRYRQRQVMPDVERYFTLAPEIVVLAGFDGYWKRVNPTVEALLGYTEQDWRARPFREFVHPDDRERSEEEARRVVGGGTTRPFENRIVCKDGSHKWIEWTATPLTEWRVIYAVGRDVTERRRSESEQAALQRIATLVAQEAPQADVFDAIAEEIGRLLGAEEVRMLRFDSDDSAVVVGSSGSPDAFALGSRLQLEGDSVALRVLRTGRPARFDDYRVAAGPNAEAARSIGVRAVVGVPVFVERRLWGAISAGSTHDAPLPPDAEGRLNEFTKLMAAAIANAESREALARLAEEQAALRRVATLVARGTPSTEVFEAVATEVAKLLETDITVLGRYDDDGAATAIGSWSASPVGVPVGTRSVIGGHNVLTLVAETGKPARVDGYDDASGEAADIARRFGWSSSIAAPVIVEGRLWGVMLVATQRPKPFPVDAENRLAAFTDLVASAVANAQSHDEVRRFGDEQAALGRVATLVAAGAAPERVFTAVVNEVSNLVGLERIELVRYDGDDTGIVIAASGDHPFPAGSTWSLDDPSVMAKVARTRLPARIDDYSALKGEIARTAREAGFQSAIGAPITVQGRLWGVIIAISIDPEPIPERSEARLGQFTDLVATAVANAESREALAELAEEQAALRRVATLVAQGASPQDLFDAVAEEVGHLLPAANVSIGRYEPDDSVTAMASWSSAGPVFGGRWPIKGTNVAWMVLQTGRSARIDDFSAATDPIGVAAREAGYKSAVGSPIVVGGRLWGVISAASTEGPMSRDTEARLASFTDLVATAIANAESSAELAASRRRIVAASDDARRRIERNLHDGVQQQLVSLGLKLAAMEAELPATDALEEQLASVTEDVGSVLDALMEIARGIHPAILSQGGLAAALKGLARRSAVPVELDACIELTVPDEVEVAAYYVASEALTNVAKHARASVVHLDVTTDDGTLALAVRDDGVGGADPGAGSGLVGVYDRVEALGGTIKINSSAGSGTCVAVTLPIATEPDQEIENLLGPPQVLGSPTSPA